MNPAKEEQPHKPTHDRKSELPPVPLTEPGDTIKAFIIYDQFTAALKACAILRRVTVRAKVGARWQFNPWRMDILKLPLESERALLEAFSADVVVFVGPQVYLLPFWLKLWAERWADGRVTRDVALVAVQDRESAEYFATAVRNLFRFATNHGLDLITGSELTLEVGTEAFIQTLNEHPLPSLTMTPVLVRNPYRAWGINE